MDCFPSLDVISRYVVAGCGFMRPFLSAGINFLGELGLPVLCVVSVLFLQKIFEPSL